MNEALKIRATLAAGETTVRVLVPHVMESGNRKDPAGKPIPAHHITDLLVTHNGRTVLQADLGPSVSKDPLLAFRFQGGQAGDRIRVVWNDNRGGSGSGEAAILG